jgi:8-oxo-dGTP diphosphatase
VTVCYEFPRPALAVDCVIFGFDTRQLSVLLIERGLEPFKGAWALPGGFVRIAESLEEAARRELLEEAGVEGVYMEQLYTFGGIQRDPRDRVVSVAYFALVAMEGHHLKATTDAVRASWFPCSQLPPLAFDHSDILDTAIRRLRTKVRYEPIGFELLPRKFSLSQLQALYEAVLGRQLDKRNFRKKILSMALLRPLDEYTTGGAPRAARLYQFDRAKYQKLVKAGFTFEL